jgi:hypothetical protein
LNKLDGFLTHIRTNAKVNVPVCKVGFLVQRWSLDESKGTLSGEGMLVNGQLAETIVAHSKEVAPGFGAIVSSSNYWSLIGRLIDQGKINMEDLQEALKQKEFEDTEIDEDI